MKYSKDYPLYLLHNDLTRITLAKSTLVNYPETRRAIHEQLTELTHLCGKIVGRFMNRGDMPTEPGDSWLSRQEF